MIPPPGLPIAIPGTSMELSPKDDSNSSILANCAADPSVDIVLEELRDLEHRLMRFSGRLLEIYFLILLLILVFLLSDLSTIFLASSDISAKILDKAVVDSLGRFLGETYLGEY